MFQRQKILFLILCVFSSLFIRNSPLNAIQNIEVIVKPRRISSRATYIFNLNLEQPLEVHDWIKIIWPKETKLPILPEDPTERRAELKRIIESIFIGTSQCSACQGLPEINYQENSIRFNIHFELNPNIHGYERINIVFTDRVGITNPEKPGFYVIKIATSKEQTPSKSIPYEIVRSQIGEPDGKPIVTVSPNGSYSNSQYKILFRLGRGGALLFNQSRLRIQFPKETIFSLSGSAIEPHFIKLNGVPVKNKIMITEQFITFISSINTENSDMVELVLEKGVGIINPVEVGEYSLQVSTSEDPYWVESNQYSIEKSQEPLIVIPNKVNQVASYQFQFLNHNKMQTMDGIFVLFPDSIQLPNTINPINIIVNKKHVQSLSLKKNLIILFPKEIFEVNSLLTVEFKPDCGIKNPAEAGKVSLGYKIADPDEFEFTSAVLIEKKCISIQSIQVDPPNAGAKAEFLFHIVVDELKGIPSGESVFIEFPPETNLPSSLFKEMVRINGKIPEEIKLIHPYTVSIHIPFFSAFEDTVKIVFLKEFGIINPPEGNKLISFSLYCSIEPNLKESKEIFLYPSLPKTTLHLLEGKKGTNDWFIKAPVLSFSTSEEGCKTFLWWHQLSENALEYTSPQVLSDGQYETVLYYYSESAFGKEETQQISLKVDTVSPILTIEKPISLSFKTNQSPFSIQGYISELDYLLFGENTKKRDMNLTINGLPASINTLNGKFSYPVALTKEKNSIQIKLVDNAGNMDEKNIEIFYRNQKPKLLFLSPKMEDTVLSKILSFTGRTEPGSRLTYNNTEIITQSDGSFQFDTTLQNPGKKSFFFSVTDTFGNQGDFEILIWYGYSILLRINSLQALSNGMKKNLDLSPFIRDSRTFVPFRFLGEELRAVIRFEKNPISKQVSKIFYELNTLRIELLIGNKECLVNDQKVIMDSPPFIINGRTVVPLRFMGENLGCKLIWNPNIKEILLQYPND